MDINIFNSFRFLAEVSTNLPKMHYFGQFKDHIWKEKKTRQMNLFFHLCFELEIVFDNLFCI